MNETYDLYRQFREHNDGFDPKKAKALKRESDYNLHSALLESKDETKFWDEVMKAKKVEKHYLGEHDQANHARKDHKNMSEMKFTNAKIVGSPITAIVLNTLTSQILGRLDADKTDIKSSKWMRRGKNLATAIALQRMALQLRDEGHRLAYLEDLKMRTGDRNESV